jgi:putative tricarboxylic transport membrane protein
MFTLFADGLQTALSPGVFLFLTFGVAVGIVIRALPGLTATMGVAVLLPLTFGMEAMRVLVMLTGLYIGGIYSGHSRCVCPGSFRLLR